MRDAIISELFKRVPLALVIIGVLTFILAAAGNVVIFNSALSISDWRWRLAVSVVGAVLTIAGIALVFVRESDKAGSDTNPDEKYLISILPFPPNQAIGRYPQVHGTFNKRPLDKLVRLFVISPQSKEVWPQKIVRFDDTAHTWSGTVHLGGTPPVDLIIMVALLGRSGRILCEYFDRVGEETGAWPSLTELPDDIKECDRVQVRKTEEP